MDASDTPTSPHPVPASAAVPVPPAASAATSDEQHRADRVQLETIESGIAEIEAGLARIDEAGFGTTDPEA